MSLVKTERYSVEFQLAASHGGGPRRVVVDANDFGDAIVVAALKLDDEGIDRWSLVRCVKETS